MDLRHRIASIILRDLFDDDTDYLAECLECADEIMKVIVDEATTTT